MNKFKNNVLVLVFSLVSFMGMTQSYDAIGIRGLYRFSSSVSYKTFVTKGNAVEVIVNFDRRKEFDVSVTALYELHKSLRPRGLSYYIGVGGDTRFNVKELSAVGVLGLDYMFSNIPLNVSIDWMPTLLRIRGHRNRFDGGGIALRYMF